MLNELSVIALLDFLPFFSGEEDGEDGEAGLSPVEFGLSGTEGKEGTDPCFVTMRGGLPEGKHLGLPAFMGLVTETDPHLPPGVPPSAVFFGPHKLCQNPSEESAPALRYDSNSKDVKGFSYNAISNKTVARDQVSQLWPAPGLLPSSSGGMVQRVPQSSPLLDGLDGSVSASQKATPKSASL